jgi:uncharacterized membrane protein YeaQ/YmgE (transglycosylase-associated protein family)
METSSIITIILIGAICGWLAGLIVRGYGLGLVGNIVVGICGSFLGTLVFTKLNVHVAAGLGGAIITGVAGAVLVLVALGVVRKLAN